MAFLLVREQVIEHAQVHRLDRHLGDRRRRVVLHQRRHRRCRDRPALRQPLPQRRLHRRLTLRCRQVQQAKILLVRRGRVLRHQRVIRQAEHARREQLLPIAILGKRSRLPHQPVDHVPVVHPLLVPAPQTRQAFEQLLRVPHLDLLGVQPGLDLFTDQPARHRVAVSLDVDQTALIDPAAQLLE
jgi:hypothetical protein